MSQYHVFFSCLNACVALCSSNKKALASTVKLREDSLTALVGKHHAAPEQEDTAHGDGGAGHLLRNDCNIYDLKVANFSHLRNPFCCLRPSTCHTQTEEVSRKLLLFKI